MTVAPREACRNLETLTADGFLGDYGLYEAIDYTPSRMLPGTSHAVVRCFMAHHQGMSLLALEHALLDGPMQRRFLSDPLVRTTELLLQERVPKHAVTVHPAEGETAEAGHVYPPRRGAIHRVLTDPNTPLPEVHLLSNGQLPRHGHERGRRLQPLARPGGHALAGGCHLRLLRHVHLFARSPIGRLLVDGVPTDAEQRPSGTRRSSCRPAPNTAGSINAIEAHTEISVSPEDDVEIRRVTLTNLSSEAREIEVTSYAEVVMAPVNADLAHRAFSNLFVQTEILPQHGAILCKRRRRRTPEEQIAVDVPSAGRPGCPQRRYLVRDRPGPVHRPGKDRGESGGIRRAVDQSPLSNTQGPVLDPIVAIRRTVTVPARRVASPCR